MIGFIQYIDENEELDAQEKELAEIDAADSEKYGVIETGGSIGHNDGQHHYYVGNIFGMLVLKDKSKEEATEYAKEHRKRLTKFERSYYGMGYRVVPMSKVRQVN